MIIITDSFPDLYSGCFFKPSNKFENKFFNRIVFVKIKNRDEMMVRIAAFRYELIIYRREKEKRSKRRDYCTLFNSYSHG